MRKTGSVAAMLAGTVALALTTAQAFAGEYTVQPFNDGWIDPPEQESVDNPDGSVQVFGHHEVDRVASVSLPFQFPFFGRLHDRVFVSDDGWLSFLSNAPSGAQNTTLPSSARPNGLVAAAWDALRTGGGSVVTFTTGDAPSRTFVVAWSHVLPEDGGALDDMSFEILLHETSGVIEIAYRQKGRWSGLSFTAGIENESGTRAFGGPNLTNTNSGRPLVGQRFTPNTVAIRGTITRDRPVASETGLGATTETALPVAGADVRLLREDSDEVIASGRTGADGSFSLPAIGLDGAPTLSVELLASGAESRVTDAVGSTWRKTILTQVVPTASTSTAVVQLDPAVDVDFLKALNVQQAAHRGFVWANDAIVAAVGTDPKKQENFTQVEIRWVPAAAGVSGYVPKVGTVPAKITISDAAANPDAYDDAVVLREYAQHLLATVAVFANALPSHRFVVPPTTPPDPPAVQETEVQAFIDGFSFWFASAVLESPRFIDTTSANEATVFDLEVPTPAASGATTAGAVAASLWDLVDGAGTETEDLFAGTLPDTGFLVFTTIDQKLGLESIPSTATAPTIGTFFTKWVAARTAEEGAASARIFIHHATIADDTSEPNDAENETTLVDTVPKRLPNLVLSPANEDRFSFAMAGERLTVAASFPESTTVELQILDGSGQVVATSGVTASPAFVSTPEAAAAGPFVARLVWKSGPAAHYTLAVFVLPQLAAIPPLRWPQGQPYAQTLSVTNGLPPATFTIKGSGVPGLTISGGTRLAGTPTTLGTFPLELQVSDASGAGSQPLEPLTFEVIEPATLHTAFGVRAGFDVDVDLGRGGLDPSWTSTSDVGAAGFSLTAGTTLRLTGRSDVPRSFEVTASATDGLQLAVDEATTTVVVARALRGAAGTAIGAGPFGFWFDAIAGSRATLDIRFVAGAASTVGRLPRLSALIDDRGAPVPLPDSAGTRLPAVVLPRTTRYFVLFDAATGFSGRVVAAALRIRPPSRISGVADIDTKTTRAEVRFTAIGGSTLRVVLASAPSPNAAKPDFIELEDPDGLSVEPLPSGRKTKDGTRKIVAGIPLAKTGEYVLTVGGDNATTGPLLYRVVIDPPRTPFSLTGTPFDVDD